MILVTKVPFLLPYDSLRMRLSVAVKSLPLNFDDTHSGSETHRGTVGPEPTEGLPPTVAVGPRPTGTVGPRPTLLVNVVKKEKTTTSAFKPTGFSWYAIAGTNRP